MEYWLSASERTIENPRELRRQGYTPAVIYGREVTSLPVQVDTHDLNLLLHQGAQRGLIEIDVDDAEHTVMVREIQRHPVKRNVLHVDFLRVSLAEKIQTSVPINVVGEKAVLLEGGILQYLKREIEVECLPNAIPDHINIDVSGLYIGDNITLGKIDPPEGVDLLGDPAELVLTIVVPKEEELEEPEPEEEEEEVLLEGEEAAEEEAEEDEEEVPEI